MSKKTALVTGTSGLLGPVWTDILYKWGYYVFGVDNPPYDLVRVEDIENFCSQIVPDIIIHNAAIDPKPGQDEGGDPFRRYEEIISVNLLAPVRINRLMIPKMIENGGGVIVIVGSIMGYIAANTNNYADGWTKAFAYNESKRALQSHCDNINAVFGKRGIRCVMPSFGPYEKGLSPQFMDGFGKKIPMRKAISKEELERTLEYCINTPSLAGEFRVDGGYTRIGA